MIVIKEKDEFRLDIFLKENGKYIGFTFGGNGDLYWSIHNVRDVENEKYSYDFFIITKENYEIYNLFEQLFYDIENINLFDNEDIPFYMESKDAQVEYLERRKRENEEFKMMCHLYNCSKYNELYDYNNKTITWYSDETACEVANFLKIKKEESVFKLEFYVQPFIVGYEEDFHSFGCIPIRFRNSGSSYDPFNLIFMRMYNGLFEVTDINDIGHQMHIEEYLHNQNQVKKLKN